MSPLLWAPLIFLGSCAVVIVPVWVVLAILDERNRRSAVRRWDAICRAHEMHREFERRIRAIERVEDREDAKLRAARRP